MDQRLFNNRHQTVFLAGEYSAPCKVLSGVPQGTVLNSRAFSCRHWQLIAISRKFSFANDSRYTVFHHQLNRWLYKHRLTYWPYKNGVRHGRWSLIQLIVNTFRLPTNTTLLMLTTHYMATPYKKLLMLSTYLGLTFDHHLNWKNHINTITAKANFAQACFMKKHHFLSNWGEGIQYHNTFVHTTNYGIATTLLYCLVATHCTWHN